jgi:DNA-binding response OmpR family regulator
LEVSEASPAVPLPDAEGTTSAEGGLLLVVDDDANNRDVLSRRLERQGHQIVAAANGKDALALLAGQGFDLVLLDLMMPEMDGFEVLRQIKADPALSETPVVMISALSEIESVARCIEMGAEDYLPKPFNPTLLRARVDASLRVSRARTREARLNSELKANYEKLRQAEGMRDDLTHMIVHDLRTPLTSLITGLQTLEMLGDNLSTDQNEMLAIALNGGQTLLGMVNDLLDISKLEDGSLKLEYGTVQDTGEGIPEEEFGRIFEKFGQVESRKAGRKMSTGLGLTFCKMAVEAHRGRIWVESELGKGSQFNFIVPLGKA